MKHIFYIHSFITYIVSSSIVSELNLDATDVVFIYGREFTYQPESAIEIFSLSKELMLLAQFPSYATRFLFLKNYRKITKLDGLIARLGANHEFIAYLPSTKNYLMQLLATHPKCRDLVFIEEGLMTYTAKFNKEIHEFHPNSFWNKIIKILKFPNHGNRSFFYRPYSYSRPLRLYALYDAIDSTQVNIDVKLLKTVKFPNIESQYKIDNDYLFIVDSVVEDGILSTETFLHLLSVFISEYLQNKSVTVWIRFRQKQINQDNIIQLFKNNSITVKTLPENVCVESVFHISRNLTVFGLHSSLLFYATIWGHNSLSLLEKLFELDREAEQRYTKYLSIPEVFYDQVRMI